MTTSSSTGGPFNRPLGLTKRVFPVAAPTLAGHKSLWLPDRSRNMGIHFLCGRGGGKSRMMGRVIAWLDFLRGVPLVIIDPVGSTIDNFLDRLRRMPEEVQLALWPRVQYVDPSGSSGSVVPLPLYYRLGDESLFSVSQRYLDTIRLLDPALTSASVEGWNPLWRTGTFVGMLLAASGCQITEAESILTRPFAWRQRFSGLADQYPDVEPALEFFEQEVLEWDDRARSRKADSFRNKVALFRLDPTLAAMFGADVPGIRWPDVMRQRQAVLIDLRHVHDIDRRRFLLLWSFQYLLEFLKSRGPGRHVPVSVIIDEVSSILGYQSTAGVGVLGQLLDDLVNVYMRGFSVWLTVAHQELYQLDPRIQKTLMSMGTQIMGVTADMEAALALAQQFFPIDPLRVKRYENVWGHSPFGPYVIEQRPVEFTLQEQQFLSAEFFKQLRPFHFLVRAAPGEGDITGRLQSVSVANVDRGLWVHEDLVATARDALSRRTGMPIERVLSDIAARQGIPQPPRKLPAHSPQPLDTMEPDDDILFDYKSK